MDRNLELRGYGPLFGLSVRPLGYPFCGFWSLKDRWPTMGSRCSLIPVFTILTNFEAMSA